MVPKPLIQRLQLPHGNVWIQRDDLLHPLISGNKGRKLAGWLARAKAEGKEMLVTYGGAYSNHLVATAAAAAEHGLKSLGILRGEEKMDNPHIRCAQAQGMMLVGISRPYYRQRHEATTTDGNTPALQAAKEKLAAAGHSFPAEKCLIIPEGGAGPEGLVGFTELIASWQHQGFQPHYLCHASATGTTAIGLALALRRALMPTQVDAIAVLKNTAEQQLFAETQTHLARQALGRRVHHPFPDSPLNVVFHGGWEHGGYAKVPPDLLAFTNQITQANGIPFEPIYTGKALWALDAMLKSRSRNPETVCFLHTGGVLGAASDL